MHGKQSIYLGYNGYYMNYYNDIFCLHVTSYSPYFMSSVFYYDFCAIKSK